MATAVEWTMDDNITAYHRTDMLPQNDFYIKWNKKFKT